jgi:hypothetical protein
MLVAVSASERGSSWDVDTCDRHLTSHSKISHLSSINFGAVSAPGVPAAGAARGGRWKLSPCSIMCRKLDTREKVNVDLGYHPTPAALWPYPPRCPRVPCFSLQCFQTPMDPGPFIIGIFKPTHIGHVLVATGQAARAWFPCSGTDPFLHCGLWFGMTRLEVPEHLDRKFETRPTLSGGCENSDRSQKATTPRTLSCLACPVRALRCSLRSFAFFPAVEPGVPWHKSAFTVD